MKQQEPELRVRIGPLKTLIPRQSPALGIRYAASVITINGRTYATGKLAKFLIKLGKQLLLQLEIITEVLDSLVAIKLMAQKMGMPRT